MGSMKPTRDIPSLANGNGGDRLRTSDDGGPLLLAIAFASDPALDAPDGLRTVRELESLGIPLATIDAPSGRFAAIAQRFGLPAECV
jgi:hypothetical protein